MYPRESNVVIGIVGPRKSGKSELGKDIARRLRHVTVRDTKGDFDFGSDHPRYRLIARSVDEVLKLWRGIEAAGDGAPVIYRPNVASPSFYADLDEIARIEMLRGNCVAFYDELADCMNVNNYEKVAPHSKRLVQQGREPAKVGVIWLSQRPSRIPLIHMSEAEWRATFFLRMEGDRDRVEQNMFGEGVPWQDLARNKHSFVYATDEIAQSATPLRLHRLNLHPQLQQRSA